MLLIGYVILFCALAIKPYDREVWFAENLPIIIIVMILVASYKYFTFSPLAYVLMSFLIYMHTIGGHFTFARVPFDFITDLFDFERNHFDRLSHFTVGFYAYPVAEFLLRKKWVNTRCGLIMFPVFFIFTVASVYEIIEWLFAISADASQGNSFLGSQGDVWDAQKDMLADGLGAILAMTVFFLKEKKHFIKDFYIV